MKVLHLFSPLDGRILHRVESLLNFAHAADTRKVEMSALVEYPRIFVC